MSDTPQDRTADGVPEVEQAHTPAPTLADDVAALLTQYGTLCAEVAVQRDDRLAFEPFNRAQEIRRQILDRIAARVPQRATISDDLPLWLHMTCGGTYASHTIPKLTICRKCDVLTGEADWRAFYVLPDGVA